jgi:hypothetical protein
LPNKYIVTDEALQSIRRFYSPPPLPLDLIAELVSFPLAHDSRFAISAGQPVKRSKYNSSVQLENETNVKLRNSTVSPENAETVGGRTNALLHENTRLVVPTVIEIGGQIGGQCNPGCLTSLVDVRMKPLLPPKPSRAGGAAMQFTWHG